MKVSVRRSIENDIEAIAQNVVAMAFDSCGERLDPAIVSAGVRNLHEKPELGFYTVAESGEKIIGSLVIVYEWSDWQNGLHWWIHSVYVQPEFRGAGIYRQMYEFIKNLWQVSPDARNLKLSVDNNNINARRAYEKLGMHETGIVTYKA